ncbi:zinc finger, CCHC-type containing protein [Tanacetum coccineum]
MAVSMKQMASNFAKLDKFEGRMGRMQPWNRSGRGTNRRMKIMFAEDSDKPKGNNVTGPSVFNMVEHSKSIRYNDNKGKRKHHDTKANPNKKSKLACCKCGKLRHLEKNCKGGKVGNKAKGLGTNGSVNGSSNSLKAFMSTSKLNDSILWYARLGHVHFKRMQDMSKGGLIPTFDMDTKKCKTCMLTKISKKLFQNVKRKTKVLELIHSDLYDLHTTPSLGNKKYFVTFIDDASRFSYVYLLHTKDEALDKFKVFKTEVELQQGSLIKRFMTDRGGEYMDTLYFQSFGIIHEMTAPYNPQQNGISKWKNMGLGCRAVVRIPDPKMKTLGGRGIECIFVGYVEHSKVFRFYVIKPNESVLINSIIELMDDIFDENRFSSVPRPSQRSLINGTEYIGGIKDEVSDQHSYCFNVEDDPKTFDEAIKSQDVAFLKEAINDEIDSIMGNNTWVDGTIEKFKARLVIHGFRQKSRIDYFDTYAPVISFLNGELDEDVYMNQPRGIIMLGNENKVCKLIKSLYGLNKFDESGKGVIVCLYVDDMLIFGTDQVHVDLTKEFLSSRFSMKDMGEADVILGVKINHEMSTPMDTSEKLMPNNGKAISQLEYSRVIGCLIYAMTSSKKQTCITSLTIESEFVALAAAGKEAEWLRNLILKISLWSKPIAPISIRYVSAATLAKAYSQMYNGKSRHLGVRHSMIRELIMNGVVFIEFVRSQQNLADDLTKGLARDLVLKSDKEMI